MGAFCIFGVSRSACRKSAARNSPVFEVTGLGRVNFTVEEWGRRRDALAEKLFLTATRSEKISPDFDAPQFCADWLASAPGEVRLAKVMVRAPKVDKGGGAGKAQWRPGHDLGRIRRDPTHPYRAFNIFGNDLTNA